MPLCCELGGEREKKMPRNKKNHLISICEIQKTSKHESRRTEWLHNERESGAQKKRRRKIVDNVPLIWRMFYTKAEEKFNVLFFSPSRLSARVFISCNIGEAKLKSQTHRQASLENYAKHSFRVALSAQNLIKLLEQFHDADAR